MLLMLSDIISTHGVQILKERVVPWVFQNWIDEYIKNGKIIIPSKAIETNVIAGISHLITNNHIVDEMLLFKQNLIYILQEVTDVDVLGDLNVTLNQFAVAVLGSRSHDRLMQAVMINRMIDIDIMTKNSRYLLIFVSVVIALIERESIEEYFDDKELFASFVKLLNHLLLKGSVSSDKLHEVREMVKVRWQDMRVNEILIDSPKILIVYVFIILAYVAARGQTTLIDKKDLKRILKVYI